MKATKKDIGLKVTFRSPTRWSNQKATRIIRDVREDGGVEVVFGGWWRFSVREHEIIEIHRGEE
jgi:hypothetical protein